MVRLRNVAKIELIAQDYSSNSYMDKNESVALAVFQRPGSNALTTGDNIAKAVAAMSKDFPTGVNYGIFYNPTQFIQESVQAVITTIFALEYEIAPEFVTSAVFVSTVLSPVTLVPLIAYLS